ncbi:MAG: hypothetical protein AB7O31_09440 [Burkholderiales bacterium]
MAACEWVSRAPAQALALTQDPSCHDALTANAGLCLAHCLSEDQNRSAPQVLSLALPATYVPAAPAAPAPLLAPVEYAAAPATGPPPRIRFQTLRL